ncbi:spore coat protein GerQ [Salipaludibacillus sp. LMS25]|jgi:spore germination protein Q|uniref:spore coat protein GerQ n=1 Tax=Salipaludibacillus sp. LMS25 TaxID=2924031 RepID=UPI0020D14883|nr:spore coat protein GerQ [Salipaludibacillus sp. LMS25]UTR16330.1 spore coat protein GerQ [Salipaludibacillus sp. LMS25]
MFSQQGSTYSSSGFGNYGADQSRQHQQPSGMTPMTSMPPMASMPYMQQPFPFQPGTPMPTPPQFAQQQFQQPFLPDQLFPGMLPIEQSYIENILRLNRGRIGTFYMTYENNEKWNAKIFKGVIEAAGRDHIIISDPQTDKRYLLLMINLDYVTFDDEIEYDYPFDGAQQQLATYPPR